MGRRSLIAVALVALVGSGAAIVASLATRSDEREREPVIVSDVREGPAQLVVDGSPTLRLWVVTSPETRADGVNGHRLSRGEGMWFGWTELTESSFWMRGVGYPLLLAWVGGDQRVIGIGRMEPCAANRSDCPVYEPPDRFRWAIELLPEDLERSRLHDGALVGMRPLDPG